jgi:hypothetical protein
MNILAAMRHAFARHRIRHARLRLAAMVEARRHHPDTVQYRARRAAALKHTRGQA